MAIKYTTLNLKPRHPLFNIADTYLNLESSLILSDDLLLKFCASTGLLLGSIESSLLLSLLLLVAYHLLYGGCL